MAPGVISWRTALLHRGAASWQLAALRGGGARPATLTLDAQSSRHAGLIGLMHWRCWGAVAQEVEVDGLGLRPMLRTPIRRPRRPRSGHSGGVANGTTTFADYPPDGRAGEEPRCSGAAAWSVTASVSGTSLIASSGSRRAEAGRLTLDAGRGASWSARSALRGVGRRRGKYPRDLRPPTRRTSSQEMLLRVQGGDARRRPHPVAQDPRENNATQQRFAPRDSVPRVHGCSRRT
jgi:hypothetical protein